MILVGILAFMKIKRFRDFNLRGYRKLEVEKMDEIHLSHFNERILKKVLNNSGFEVITTTIEFHDTFMRNPGPIQIVRHVMLFFSKIIKFVTGINTYNSFGIIAKKMSF